MQFHSQSCSLPFFVKANANCEFESVQETLASFTKGKINTPKKDIHVKIYHWSQWQFCFDHLFNTRTVAVATVKKKTAKPLPWNYIFTK